MTSLHTKYGLVILTGENQAYFITALLWLHTLIHSVYKILPPVYTPTLTSGREANEPFDATVLCDWNTEHLIKRVLNTKTKHKNNLMLPSLYCNVD